MGWNSWNHFACNINQELIKKTADRIVQLGLDKKGYNYVNLDDCWQISRDNATGEIIQDKAKFPAGIDALTQYIHGKGLKIGLYSDAGLKTCQGRPGGFGYEKIDATTYARWQYFKNYLESTI